MAPEEQCDPSRNERQDDGPAPDLDEDLLPTISLVPVAHGKIPNLYQWCYEYVEPWQWSSEAERVETGHWFLGPAKDSL